MCYIDIVVYAKSSNIFTYQAEKAARSGQGGDAGKADGACVYQYSEPHFVTKEENNGMII